MPKISIAALAANLRSLRARAKLSQADLAGIAGVSQSAYGDWERENSSPGALELAALCLHYKVSPEYMLGLTPFETGLPPDSWLVDLDEVETPTPGELWAIKVPRRHRIVDYDEYKQLQAEVHARAKATKQKKGS